MRIPAVLLVGALCATLVVKAPVQLAAQEAKPPNQSQANADRERADQLYNIGKTDEALAIYERIAPSFANDFEFNRRLADGFFASPARELAKAARYYARAHALDPSSAEVSDKLVRSYMGLRRYSAAAGVAEELVKSPDAPAEAWELLARAYDALHQPDKAVPAYVAYLERSPGDEVAQTDLARLYLQLSDNEKAMARYNLVLSSNPRSSAALLGKAGMLARQKQFDESLKLYDRVLRIDPKNAEAETGRAFALLWQGRDSEALPLFEKLHGRYPDNAEVARGLQQAQEISEQKALGTAKKAGNKAQIMEYYKGRVARDPHDLTAFEALMEINSDPAHCPEGVGFGRRALRVSPGNPDVELALARMLIRCQDYAGGIAQYQDLVAAHPENQAALYELAEASLHEGRFSEATEVFRKLLVANPSHLGGRVGLGRALSAAGQYDQALAEFERALQQAPDEYDALQGKAYILYYQKDFTGARSIFRQLAQARPSDPQNPQALRDIDAAEEAAHWAALRPAPGAPPQSWKKFYLERLATYPNDRDALKGVASTEAQLGDPEGALRDYQKVLALYPDDQDAQKEKARLAGVLEDRIVAHARELAYSGKEHRAEALSLLRDHLQRVTDDSEARVLYGTVLSWDGQYDESRKQLEMVLANNPTHSDALPALINVELWSDHPQRAAELARRGLQVNPKNVALITDEAHAMRNMGRDRDAAKLYSQAIALDPTNQELKDSYWSFKKFSGQYWEFNVDHTYEFFNKILSGQNETSVSARASTPVGSVTLHERRADRFGLTSYQTQVDYWPGFRPGTYAYLSVGYSPDANLYPRTLFGSELFEDTHGFEFSGGYRFMHFSSNVNIYTFSLGRYYGDWLFVGRTYLTPGQPGLSNTEVFTARRFLGSEGLHDYIQFSVSAGASPALARTTLNLLVLDSFSGGVTIDKTFGHFDVSLKASMAREEQTYANNLRRYTLDGQIYYRF